MAKSYPSCEVHLWYQISRKWARCVHCRRFRKAWGSIGDQKSETHEQYCQSVKRSDSGAKV
jgi:hypothetical protein